MAQQQLLAIRFSFLPSLVGLLRRPTLPKWPARKRSFREQFL